MAMTQAQTKQRLGKLLADFALAKKVSTSKTKRGAIGLLVRAAKAKGIGLTEAELHDLIGGEKPPKVSSLNREQLVTIAGRAFLGKPTTYFHTCSCYHCIKTCL